MSTKLTEQILDCIEDFNEGAEVDEMLTLLRRAYNHIVILEEEIRYMEKELREMARETSQMESYRDYGYGNY